MRLSYGLHIFDIFVQFNIMSIVWSSHSISSYDAHSKNYMHKTIPCRR